MKNSSTLRLREIGSITILLVVFLFSNATIFAQLTVTKTYTAPSSVTVDGCGLYCTNLPGITFSAADFTAGVCQVADVNISITWAKTDGSCSSPALGNSFHNETNFRIDGPAGNEILVVPGTYTGSASISAVTTILDQAAASVIGGVTPVSGTFIPNNGNLDNYIGTDPFGTWTLRAGDTGGGDPLCIVGYSVTITMSAAIDADGDSYTICGGDCDDNDPLVNPGVTEITCDGIDNDCNPLTLDDPTPPIALCQSINVYLDGSGLASITAAQIDMGSTDNCTLVSLSVSPSSFACTDLGSQNVILSVTDGIGNTSTCATTVMVIDTLAPIADSLSLPDVTGYCQVDTIAVTPTAIDNCVGAMVTVTNDATYPITSAGTTVITWTYADTSGNTSIQTQNVIITDTLAPIADAGSLVDLNGCNSVMMPIAPTATDDCAGSVTGTTTTTFPITSSGTTIVTWTYDDGNGNTSTQMQNVIVAIADAGVTESGFVITADAIGAMYQWLDCDNAMAIIVGATSQSYTASTTGNYAVEVTENGCVDTSVCTLIDYSGLNPLELIEVSIYPNPTDGIFSVEFSGNTGENLEMRIIDIAGRIIVSETFIGISGSHVEKVDISQNEQGVYIINLFGDNGLILSKRILKK